MISRAQNTNFGTKIVVSQKAYYAKSLEDLYMRGKYVDVPWSLKESKFCKDECYTAGIKNCTAGILKAKDGDEFYMFHLNPNNEENSWHNVAEGLQKAQERLKKGNPNMPLEGFLVGAKSIYDNSVEQARNLLSFFEDAGVKFSALLSQPEWGLSNFHYSLPKDEITMFHYNRSSQFNNSRNKGELEKHFSKVKYDPNDTFEFCGE